MRITPMTLGLIAALAVMPVAVKAQTTMPYNGGYTSQRVGNTTFIHGNDGSSLTCQNIGSTTFCN